MLKQNNTVVNRALTSSDIISGFYNSRKDCIYCITKLYFISFLRTPTVRIFLAIILNLWLNYIVIDHNKLLFSIDFGPSLHDVLNFVVRFCLSVFAVFNNVSNQRMGKTAITKGSQTNNHDRCLVIIVMTGIP